MFIVIFVSWISKNYCLTLYLFSLLLHSISTSILSLTVLKYFYNRHKTIINSSFQFNSFFSLLFLFTLFLFFSKSYLFFIFVSLLIFFVFTKAFLAVKFFFVLYFFIQSFSFYYFQLVITKTSHTMKYIIKRWFDLIKLVIHLLIIYFKKK